MAVLTPASVYAPGRKPPKPEIIQLLNEIIARALPLIAPEDTGRYLVVGVDGPEWQDFPPPTGVESLTAGTGITINNADPQAPSIAVKRLRIGLNLEFYRNPQTALIGTTNGTAFNTPGNALSSSTIRWRGDLGLKVVSAIWRTVWTPGSPAANVGSRICWADDGPTNITEIARHVRNSGTTPVVDATDVTAAFNAQTANKQILHQTIGDGSLAASIYGQWIELVYEAVDS